MAHVFDQEQLELRSAIRGFLAAEIEPIIDQHERDKTFPYEVLPKLAEFGYLGGWLAEDLGGLGISRVTWAMMMEELGSCWSSLRTMVNISNGPIERLAVDANAEQRAKYLEPLLAGQAKVFNGITEPDVGSDVSSIKMRAELDGDEWVLNGAKMWITGGIWGDFGIVIARTFSPDCDGELSSFLIDKRETPFVAEAIDAMTLRCTGTALLTFNNVRIPKENLLGTPGGGLKATLSGLGVARVNIAAGAVGAAQRCLDLSIEYAKTRKQFGRPIASFQLIQKYLVDMKIRVDASRALCYAAASALDRGESGKMEGSIAKLYASQSAFEVADMAIQVHGAMGYSNEYPIARFFRDTRGGSIPEGTAEVQTLIIGRELTGIGAFK
ncbi:acyl-CoA dehydrogenase [Rhodococcus sp. IEGM 1379]|uniref:acyl-CoA dehydrogenase family protein n=1 Tax=Rhodococcus sp. IEGM 1379 TaxID=3047086 RepID=UPI0024B79E89|nr:acyl-CoA dehydrogenase [Rhodococcus sp. IEGM 1379]MDI9915366.1 acyl-CoA dehydrogenase [Rhodococcus sp. IEGM 1379]